MSGRLFLVLGAALATTIFQVYRIQTKNGGSSPRSSMFTSSNPFGAPPPSSTVEGLEGYQSQADWGMVRGALTSRLTLHSATLETLDGRTAVGAGYRSLSILTRPGVVQAATLALLGPANATAPALEGTWLAGGGQHWVPPLLLLSLHETDTNNGFGGEKPRRVRHFYEVGRNGPGGKGRAPTRPHKPPRHGGKPSLLDHQGWDERHIPKGPARGKAARAFGAHARGPSLAARTRDPNFAPTLTLQLHVHIPGFTCSLPGGSASEGSETNSSSGIDNVTASSTDNINNNKDNYTRVQDSTTQDTSGTIPPPTAAAYSNKGVGNKEGAAQGVGAGGGTLTPIALPLPPCPPHFPTLPYTRPATSRARESLHAATREKSTLTASAPVSAPFLTWCEALLAIVLDVKRVNLGEVVGPEGGVVLMGVREVGEEGVIGLWGRTEGEGKGVEGGGEEDEGNSPAPIPENTTTTSTGTDKGGGLEAGEGQEEEAKPPSPQAQAQTGGEEGDQEKVQAQEGQDL